MAVKNQNQEATPVVEEKVKKGSFFKTFGEKMANITLKDIVFGIVKLVVPAAMGFGAKAFIDSRRSKRNAAIECEYTESIEEPVSYMSVSNDSTNAQ